MRGPAGWLVQVAVVTLLNVRTVRQRLGSSLVAVVGIAGVVTIFVAVLSTAEGFRRTVQSAGSRDTAVVLRAGSDSEMVSVLSREDVSVIGDAAGLRRGAGGAVVSGELFVIVDLLNRATNTTANVSLRGVGPNAFAVRPEVAIIQGRAFEAGRNELIVGRGAAAQFAGTAVGRTLRFGRSDWTVVGIFDAGGTLADSELWCDAAVLQPLYQRGTTVQAVYAKLESPEAFAGFKDALTSDPRLNVKVMRETDYYAEQSQMITALISTIGVGIALLMGIGAVFGAVNTMYTAVAARTREIAVLRALGFGGGPVAVSVLVESLLLAGAGGLAGGAIAYAAFHGFRTSTMNWQSFSQVTFAFAVTPGIVARGVAYALAMGLAGGLLPAVRAARLPIVSALREL
ncbi:MAG TPA: ABC transporter permease [Vicinamibacterales bacterium]|mgnify:FL=1|nr:ABC transporter permease [Vicinamibacterales bacterium]